MFKRAVAEGALTEICRHILEYCWVKNGELVMAGVVGRDCRDKMADRLARSYR